MIFYLTLACKWILRDAIDISGSRSIIGADTMVPLFTLVLIHARITNIHLLLYILMQYGEYDEQGDVSYNIANLEGSMLFVMSLEVSEEIDDLFETTDLFESIVNSLKPENNNNNNNSNSQSKSMSVAGSAAWKKKSSAAMSTMESGVGNAALLGLLEAGSLEGSNTMASSSPSSYDRENMLKQQSTMSMMTSSTNNSNTRTHEDMKAMEELGNSIFSFSVFRCSCFLSFLLIGEWLRDQQTMEETIAILQNDGWML
jgi:hypothetical protein